MKFKVGDKVRRKLKSQSDRNSYYQGNPFLIKEIFHNRETRDPAGGVHMFTNLELVESPSELQELVDKANAGEEAMEKLASIYKDKVEGYWPHRKDPSAYKVSIIQRSRIRIKSQIRKFKVAQWEAEITGEEVKIGCKTFKKEFLTHSIRSLVQDNCNFIDEFQASRKGITFQNSNHITWQEAEDLLKELEK